MPHAIGLFLVHTAVGAITVLTAIGLSPAAALFIVDIGVKLTGLALLGNLAKKLVDIPDLNDTAKSNLVTSRGTLEHQKIIYGEVLVSGPLAYLNTAGDNNKELYHAVVLAGHQIEDITDVWLDDEIIPEASIDWAGDGSVDSGWLAGDTSLATTGYFHKFLGTDDQSASADLVAKFSEVTSQHQGRNIAWLLTRLDYFEGQTDVFSRGAPGNYKALAKGKLVYNPNSDSTQAWGTGPHRVNSAPTWEYSNNPALCWADYMIDSELGFGEAASRIDYAYVATATAINSVVLFTPVGTDHRFSCNGRLSTATPYKGNLESILSSANMTMALVQGQWQLRGWAYETPTLDFSDDDVRDDIQIALSIEEDKRYNTVRPYFIDKDRRWQAQQAPAFTSSEYVARDNAETLFKDIQLPMTTDNYMAQRLAAGILEQSDLQSNVIYPSNFKTLPVEIGGTIKYSNEKMQWADEVFRVTNYKLNDLKGINLILQEENAGAYTDVTTAEYTVASDGSYVVANPGVPAPSSLWADPLINGINIGFTPPAPRLYETTKVFWSTNNSQDQAIEIGDVRGRSFLHRVERPQRSHYWVKAVNFTGKESVFFPNSDQTDVIVLPSLVYTQRDWGFSLSDDWEAFWESHPSDTNVASYTSINSTGISNGNRRAMHFSKANSEAGTYSELRVRDKVFIPISGAAVEVELTYRVESIHGPTFDSSSSGLTVQFGAYAPGALSDSGGAGGGGQGKPTAPPNSWDLVNGLDKIIRMNSLDLNNNWETARFTLSNSQSNFLGATHIAFSFGLHQIPRSTEFDIHIDHVSYTPKNQNHEGYTITDIGGTIVSGKLDLDYADGNSVFVPVDATINSIEISNWPASGLGEMAITFQQSGSAAAVVNTDAWPGETKWNNGVQFILGTSSGQNGRVFLSTRDAGSVILADRADAYS